MERPGTPIYQRISKGLKDALEGIDHQVLYFDSSQFYNHNDAVTNLFQVCKLQQIDYCIITGDVVTLLSLSPEEKFIFELIEIPLIFVHYDNIAAYIERNKNFLQRLLKVKDRSFHFCLEYSNSLDLRIMGFKHVYSIYHASEFFKSNHSNYYNYEVSFVGSLLKGVESSKFIRFSSHIYSHYLQADFWNRLARFDFNIEQSAIDFSKKISENNINYYENKYYYIYLMTLMSTFFRGELIKKLTCTNIDIIGGYPASLQNSESNISAEFINKPGIRYHPSTTEANQTRNIYTKSKINLNISSLQFDNAVVNRVIDVAAASGFILTDWKPELQNITSVSEEISYRTLEELNYKIDYYLSHEKERLEIAHQLNKDVKEKYQYHHIINFILNKISNSNMSNLESEICRVDLGCGAWKPEGFIGVDKYSKPGVDIVADLNQRFPFPDNSVDEVRAHDVIEHLPNRIHTMNEIWRICKPNARVDIRVPSTDGRGVFQDPTHVSFWNINSFMYYCIEFPAYIDLCKSYGFEGKFKLLNLEQEELPDRVVIIRAILLAIKETNASFTNELNYALCKEIKLIIFPDWCESEESLVSDLTDVLQIIVRHPDREKITLFVDISEYDENAELIISGILLKIFEEETLEIANDEPEVFFLDKLSEEQWEVLLQQITYRLEIENENKNRKNQIENLNSCKLDTLSNKRFIQLDENYDS